MTEANLSIIQSLLDTGDLMALQIGALKFAAGSTIFREGENADCAYMVDSGYVEVSREGEAGRESLAMLGPGEIFGEIALIDGLARSATATAIHESSVVIISRQQLLNAISDAGPLARLVLIAAVKRLRVAQAQVHSAIENRSDNSSEEGRLDPYYNETRLDAARQLRLRVALEAAIKEQQFELAFQPIVTLADGRTAGFEALLRWPRPGQANVSPAEFIPIAEETGLILPLGRWVLDRALYSLSILNRKLGRARDEKRVFMSVNVSPRQLDSEENVEELAQVIERPGLDPTEVKLEITEQALLRDPRLAMLSLARLKATGASLAIDDFGTGYSSLSYLHQFPLDTMKVDRSFVSKVADDAGRQRVVAAIIALAHELGMDVVAEGIEEIEELQWLQSHSCRYGQGYFMAKPLSFEHALNCVDKPFEW